MNSLVVTGDWQPANENEQETLANLVEGGMLEWMTMMMWTQVKEPVAVETVVLRELSHAVVVLLK